ncbi:hypothetical protein HK097_005560 [Rhizophlyctis rosea]|uniref:Uncharacterized protein n=1 Tax=Rhizophlyctis rosea TaxID=64517 RepID=A0AAD5SM76_9FUNG|nr:hypothetical protein HK097_005560 [Rhizophlyctis rosea]
MATGAGYEPLMGLNQLQQASDHRDDLKRYQNLHLATSSTESVPRAPVVSGPIAGVDTGFGGGHNGPTTATADYSYGSGPTNFVSAGATIGNQSSSGATQLEQYAALRNAAESVIGHFPTAGLHGSYTNGISEPGISHVNSGGPAYSSDYPATNAPGGTSFPSNLAPQSKVGYTPNYTTNAHAATGPKPNLVSRQTVNGPIGQGTTTQVKGNPLSNTITLSSRTLKGGSGCVVEAVDTYTYRRPETTNGEYGNFPQRQHEEHVLSPDEALNGRSGTLTTAGGPGTAEEKPNLERHGALA